MLRVLQCAANTTAGDFVKHNKQVHVKPYLHVHAHTRTYIYACIYTHAHTHSHARKHAHTHTHTYSSSRTFLQMIVGLLTSLKASLDMPNAASALCDAAGKGDIGQVQPAPPVLVGALFVCVCVCVCVYVCRCVR